MVAVLLCAVMLAVAVAGCTDNVRETESADNTDYDFSNEDTHFNIDFDSAFAAYQPDTVMISVGDSVVTWEELFFYLFGNVYSISSEAVGDFRWSYIAYDDVTFAEVALTSSVDNALVYKAAEYGASLSGIALSAKDYDNLREEYELLIENFEDPEEFLGFLW